MHTIANLHAIDVNMQLVLVLPKEQLPFWDDLKKAHSFSIPHSLAEGGETRFLSVKNGLEKVADSDVVGIHDGVRSIYFKNNGYCLF